MTNEKKNQLEQLFSKINFIEKKYKPERERNKFNILKILHKTRDEVNLHSRIISYLLNPKSSHEHNNIFLKIFVEKILKLSSDEFDVSNCEVFPNEEKKSEYNNIDILIINRTKKQAIIIENKIDAGDSNRLEKKNDGYDGQLERYYNTIKTGKNANGVIDKRFQCDTVFVFYLCISKNQDEEGFQNSLGVLKDISESWKGFLYYGIDIIYWLEECYKEDFTEKQLLKELITHYLNLIKEMTNNHITIEERIELTNSISGDWKNIKYLIDNFKHIKWHTIYNFWHELKEELEKNEFKNIVFYTTDSDVFEKTITDVSHKGKKPNYGLKFNLNDYSGYISGENNLSWGIFENPKKYFSFENDEMLKQINFSDFSTENTYKLIDIEERKKIILEIIN